MRLIQTTRFSHSDDVFEKHSLYIKTPNLGAALLFLFKLPPMKEIPLYAGASHGSTLWCSFNMVITLQAVFFQQGNKPSQVTFKNILPNIRNVEYFLDDLDLLMSRKIFFLSQDEMRTFHDSMHLFTTKKWPPNIMNKC